MKNGTTFILTPTCENALNGSKWNFSSVYLRNKKKNPFIFLSGPPLPFRPSSTGRPGLPPRPLSAPARHAQPAAELGGRVSVRRRRRSPRGHRWPPRPSCRAYTRRATSASLSSISFASCSDNSSSARARLQHRPHQRLAGFGRSGHSSSPSTAPSRPVLLLHLMHPVLAPYRRGKL